MPRTPLLIRMPMPEIRPRPLYRAERKRFAWLLGLDVLPDACAHGIAWLIAELQGSRKLAKGHTAARVASTLDRIENRMHRGHDDPETAREITDPLFGMDGETVERLAPIVADPEVPLESRRAVLEVRRREVEALPEVDARHGLRVVLVAYALVLVWWLFAVDRDDGERQWLFVLAILEAAGERTPGVRKNPKRLKRLRDDVEQLLQLTAQPAGSA